MRASCVRACLLGKKHYTIMLEWHPTTQHIMPGPQSVQVVEAFPCMVAELASTNLRVSAFCFKWYKL